MFRHVVLLRWIPDATPDQRSAVRSGLLALPAIIPELREYTVGTDAGVSEGNFDLVAIADFDDVSGYLAYRDHPVHVAVITDHIRPILAERAAIQHEF